MAAGGVGLAAAAVAGRSGNRAIAARDQMALAASWPKSLDTLFGGAEFLAKRVAEATDNKFQIRVFAGGEIVPALQVLDAVQNNTVEMGHTASYYYVGKDPTFSFDCTVPFGMNARQMNAWMTHGGGLELLREFFKDYNIYNIPAGNTGAQMGGWYRKEIKTVADLNGLKFRIAGLAGSILTKLGVVPRQSPAATSTRPSKKARSTRRNGSAPMTTKSSASTKSPNTTITRAGGKGPAQLSAYVNIGQWQSLPKSYQAILTAACAEANTWTLANTTPTTSRHCAGWSPTAPSCGRSRREILDACYKATQEFYAETAAKNTKWKTIYEPWKKFLDDEHQWFRVDEQQFDNYMLSKKT